MLIQTLVLFLGLCQRNIASTATNNLTEKYLSSVNASKILQKNDRVLMKSWADDHQVKTLDVCLKYRMSMMQHEEHNFKSHGDVKWINCLNTHRREIRRCKRFYHQNEFECLRISSSKDDERKVDVEQLEKQINKWRKTYRYLVNLCDTENPGNKEDAEQCLIEYMQNDRYDAVMDRLILLKQSAMSELYTNYKSAVIELEECLKSQLSRYLERVRAVRETLNKCYSINS